MRTIDNVTGQEVKPGDTVVSFRGERAQFGYPDAPQVPGKSGKVCVLWLDRETGKTTWRGWYYDKVFDVTVLSDADFAAREALNRFIDAQ